MPAISPEQLRDLSVRAVEGFFNNKIPLSEGLAKEASALELNSEQIHRGVEAVNNITYLKMLTLAPDRTVEFDLCKYAEVIETLAIPAQPTLGLAKVASAPKEITYEASVQEIPDYLKKKYLLKEAMLNKAAIERLETKASHIKQDLIKVAKDLSTDESWMDKLACVTTPEEFSPLSVLVSGQTAEYNKRDGLFKEASLKDCNSLTQLYRDAYAVVGELAERQDLQKRAEEHIKEAFFGAIAGVAGRLVGKVVGGTLKAPFKLAGSAISKGYSAIATPIKASSGADLSKQTTKLGRGKVQAQTVGKITGKIGGKLIGGAALASYPIMYNPSKNTATGQRNDGWDKIQS